MKELKEWIRSILIAIFFALIIRAFVMESFIVDGSSMFPTFVDQERVLVNKFVYRYRDPKYGEIVVFPIESGDKILIKRIIGLPGSKVEVKSEKLYIDDEIVEENFTLYNDAGIDFGPIWIPEGQVFLMGDNRNNSLDSRSEQVGFVEIEDIRGKTFMRYWPITKLKFF